MTRALMIFGCGTFAISVATLSAGAAPAPSVALVKVHRRAECLRPPATAWTAAAAGTSLAAEDSIRTENNSYADLQLDPPNRFRLKENSLLKIGRIAMEEKSPEGSLVKLTDLGLLKGEVVARLDGLPSGSRLVMRSPVAVAAVRGTEFLAAVGEADATRVGVSRGSVDVEAAGEPEKRVTVKEDQRTVVAAWSAARLTAKGTGLPPKEMLLRRLDDPKVPLKDAAALLDRLKNPKPSLAGLTIGASASASAPTGIGDAPEAERWARNEAQYRAQKEIIGKLETVRLSGDETVGDLMNKDPALCRALLSATGEGTALACEYDAQSRTASARLAFPLERVRKITGRDMSLSWKSISPVSIEEYAAAYGGLIRVAAERAAVVDAYRRLAEKIYGTVVNTSTTVKSFAVQDDRVEIAVKGIVQGAEEVSKTYYSDGSVDIVLQIAGSAVRSGVTAVIGDKLGEHYMSSPAALEADEFIGLLAARQI